MGTPLPVGSLAAIARALRGSGLSAVAGAAGLADPNDDVIGLVWATVDLDRSLGDAGLPSAPGRRDEVLGARTVRVHPWSVGLDPGSTGLIIVEPDTEGRAAAFLARHGEGLCAVYLTTKVTKVSGSATALGRVGRVRSPGPRWGPFVVEVGPVG